MAAAAAPAQQDVERGADAPPLSKAVSAVGKDAVFKDGNAEVERILANSKNYYIVLKVRKDTAPAEIRTNFLRLSRLVHPDKLQGNERAADASAVVNQAYGTLSNAIKKGLYDRYIDDVNVDAPEGVSYAEWEAAQAAHPVQLPKWLEAVLRIPGAGVLLLLILFPLTIILLVLFLVLALVLQLLCLPVRLVCGCCGPPPPPAEGGADAEAGAAEAKAGPQ